MPMKNDCFMHMSVIWVLSEAAILSNDEIVISGGTDGGLCKIDPIDYLAFIVWESYQIINK